jgi:hypothetical protein
MLTGWGLTVGKSLKVLIITVILCIGWEYCVGKYFLNKIINYSGI